MARTKVQFETDSFTDIETTERRIYVPQGGDV